MKAEITPTAASRTIFEFPPITELAIGVRFPSVVQFKSQQVGLYWERIRQQLPLCEQQLSQVQIGADGQISHGLQQQSPGEIFPMPRFVFFGSKSLTLIQVQKDGFWLNWRQTSEAVKYPLYEEMARLFWREFQIFKTFIGEIGGNLEILSQCELTYVNLLNPTENFSIPEDIGIALPCMSGFKDLAASNRTLAGINTSITYKLSKDLLVDSSIKLGRRLDTNEPVIALELRAHGAPSSMSFDGAKEWLDLAHEDIYKLFIDITSERMQKEQWKPL